MMFHNPGFCAIFHLEKEFHYLKLKNLELGSHYSRANAGLLLLIDSEGFVFGKGFISPQLDLDDSLP